MKVEPVALPEFGVDVNWAMCRNPMCPNFGRDLAVEIPDGRAQASDQYHTFRKKKLPKGHLVGEIECALCGQSSRLPSNRALRPIARYFLSLSLPFADCPNEQCRNHGINLFENWANTGSGLSRFYRRQRDDKTVRCSACGKAFSLGTALPVPAGRELKTSETSELQARRFKARQEKKRWKEIIEGVVASRSVTDTFERLGIPIDSYYRDLQRIGRRLRDYHSWRNAGLLRPERARQEAPVGVYSDVMDISLRANREERRYFLFKVIVSVLLAENKIYVLAAHPFFLPKRHCPWDEARRPDVERFEFEKAWISVQHPGWNRAPGMSGEERMEDFPELGRGGYFIRSPYAEVAHFLVVQKMLSRFQVLHCYMDAAQEMSASALVAMRDRVLAGRPDQNEDRDRRTKPPKRAEIALYQHEKAKGVKAKKARLRKGKPLEDAWAEMEERFDAQEVPDDLLKGAVGRHDPKVRASLFKLAFKGARSKKGAWAWLEFPPDSAAYRRCRTLWVTRMPGKDHLEYGLPTLRGARMQPVDAIMNSMRARVRAVSRPLLRADGRGYRSSYMLPEVVMAELWVYLLRQNYTLRRKTTSQRIPARALGLVTDGASRLDLLEVAWGFRLGLEHGHRISRWQRR